MAAQVALFPVKCQFNDTANGNPVTAVITGHRFGKFKKCKQRDGEWLQSINFNRKTGNNFDLG